MNKILETIKSKWTEYLLEILVIMIGILGAFTLNNWNEQRKTNEFEYQMLRELRSATIANLKDLDQAISMTSQARKSCDLLLEHLLLGLDYSDSLDKHFSQSIFWFKSVPDRGSYETAKNYGLQLFKNDSLRTTTSFLYESRMAWIQAQEKRNHDYFYNHVTPIIQQFFDSNKQWSEISPLQYDELGNQANYLHILRTLQHDRDRDIMWFDELRKQLKSLELLITEELNSN